MSIFRRVTAPGSKDFSPRALRHRALCRLGAYAVLLAAGLAYLALSEAGHGPSCLFLKYGGFVCPSCGATRALLDLLHFNIPAAVAANPVFALALYPIGGILALDDIAAAAITAIRGRERLSLLRFLFGKKEARPS